MKKIIILILMICFATNLFAQAPTANDVTVAIAAITDSAICSVAAFLNTPSLELPGIALHFRKDETLPFALSFRNSDIGSYLAVFQKTKVPTTNFFTSLLQAAKGPLNDIALQYLTVHAWEMGHAVLTGAAVADWGEVESLATLMAQVVASGAIPPVAIATDILVSGRRVSTSVRVEGVFLIHTDEEGYFSVQPIELKINGEKREV